MPRRQTSHPVPAVDEAKQQLGPLTKVLTDHDFADSFFGEASSKSGRQLAVAPSPNGDADGDADMVGHDSRNGNVQSATNGGASGTPVGSRLPRRGSFDFDNTPVDLNDLMLRQLKEDREAYRYDLEWTRHQVSLVDITPAESRTYQLRLLDLGHQLRQINHRIHMREAEMHNTFRFGPSQPAYGAQLYSPNAAYHVSFMNGDPPQERRGPGRPLGSKNRSRESVGANVTPGPQPPPNSAQKAAALASAGAKRILPTEIRVATPNGEAAEPGPLAKRPRIQVGSPLGSTTEEDNNPTVSTNIGDLIHNGDTTNEDPAVDNGLPKNLNPNTNAAAESSFLSASTPPTPGLASTAAYPGTQASQPVDHGATPGGGIDETGPGGSAYQRLGHWMCTLCTSQKYLQEPTPKQPSEPSSWPLRDVSKIVTHFTRMHGEHNRMERCMELGQALEANMGPFRYWIQETKREKITLHEVRHAIDTLKGGQLPDLLRKLSTAAKNFPRS